MGHFLLVTLDMATVTEPVQIDVLLSYENLPQQNKKGMILRSMSKKKKTKGVKGPKSKAHTADKAAKGKTPGTKSKKKKRNKKKQGIDNIEVTTMTEDVLEDPEDLDQAYKTLKDKVMTKMQEADLASQISKV